MSDDLKKAVLGLDGGAAICAVLGVREVKAVGKGVRPFYNILAADKNALNGYCVADRAAGAAAAYMAAYASVKEYYAGVLSKAGEAVLKRFGIKYYYGALIDRILNPKGELCPFESLLKDLGEVSPEAAFNAIGDRLKVFDKFLKM